MNSSFDILLIDDDPFVRAYLSEAMRLSGYSVLLASGGDVALALLAQHEFRAVVTDVLMPSVDGYEVIVHLRKHAPVTRILAMSAGGRVGESGALLRAARCLGAHATLEKPFSSDQFLDALRGLLSTAPAGSLSFSRLPSS